MRGRSEEVAGRIGACPIGWHIAESAAQCPPILLSPGEPVDLLQIIAQLLGPGGVPKLSKRLCFDLQDALARDVELASHLLESPAAAILEAEAELQHLSL